MDEMTNPIQRNAKRVLYFVKDPVPGRVKTRLSRSVGPENAAELYRKVAEQNLMVLKGISGRAAVTVFYDPPDAAERIKAWLGPSYEYIPQRGLSLGERLAEAFRWSFDARAEKTLVLGSDTIGLELGHVSEAFDLLEAYDAVLGPSEDGGYFLMGIKTNRPELFQNISWSTPLVLEQTVLRIRDAGMSYGLISELNDLDDVHDLTEKERMQYDR